MKLNKLVLVVSVSFLVLSCINNNKNKIVYPYTKTVAQEDDYHGTIVKDPYRWLEDMDSKEVKDWIFEQQKFEVFAEIRQKNSILAIARAFWHVREVESYAVSKFQPPTALGDHQNVEKTIWKKFDFGGPGTYPSRSRECEFHVPPTV